MKFTPIGTAINLSREAIVLNEVTAKNTIAKCRSRELKALLNATESKPKRRSK